MPEVGLLRLVEDVVGDTTEQWTAASIDSEDENAECRAAMQNTETDKEDADVSNMWYPSHCVGLGALLMSSRYSCRKIRVLRLFTLSCTI